jgi:hypothetical protein
MAHAEIPLSRRLAARLCGVVAVAALAAAAEGGCTVVAEPLPKAAGSGGSGGSSGGSSGMGGGSGGSSGSSSGGIAYVDANACQPGAVQTFVPAVYHPSAPPWQGVCTAHQSGDLIARFYDACLGAGAMPEGCAGFKKEYPDCAGCIVTPETAAAYGPLIDHGGFVTANEAGCLEVRDPAAITCAKSVQALSGCELAACVANCPVTDATSLSAYGKCTSQADAIGCATYVAAASCTSEAIEAGPSAVADCVTPDFKRFYDAVVPFFCGDAPPDAGMVPPPAEHDASPE